MAIFTYRQFGQPYDMREMADDLQTLFAGIPQLGCMFNVVAAVTHTVQGCFQSGTVITQQRAFVTTVANASDAVCLPLAKPGMDIEIINMDFTHNTALGVLVQSGDSISITAVSTLNGSTTVNSGTVLIMYCGSQGVWVSK
jgi:hypothetical protein